ncbi:MAG TPA: hypothetical protein VIK66_11515 [Gaiellaceae bacterium]
MKRRLGALVLTIVSVALVLFIPGAAHSDTAPTPFSGSFSATACGTPSDFSVAGANETISVTVDATVASNDIAVNLLHGGSVVANTDTGVGQEELTYKTADGGTYSVQVCPSSAPAAPFVDPMTYSGVFQSTSAPAPVPPGSIPGSNGITPSPTYTRWNAVFGASTAIDAQRTEGEPLDFFDAQGNWWESGPWGTTTQNSFVHKSTDGGKSFHVVSPIQMRPDAGPGGGDTDIVVDDQGFAYFVDLEALVNLGTSVSNDGGNTWRKNPAAVQNAAVDRQWYALDNGTTPAASDNTLFLAFHETAVGTFIYSSPGSTGAADPVGGLVWQSASASGPIPLASDATCAQLRFDSVTRNLYYACNEGDHIRITVGHVDPGQRTGITFTNYKAPQTPGGQKVLNLFPALATDQAGNVYVAWIDGTNYNLYYSFSTDQGKTWSAPTKVNSGQSVTNEFDWAQAGTAGTLALAWYGTGTSTSTGSDGMPNYLDDPDGATAFPWYGYAALIRGANTAGPTIAQVQFTEKPMHYGQICNAGLNCTTSGGDRQMADFFGFQLGPDGGLRIVYDDTTNTHDGASLMAARQVSGATALGTGLKALPATGGVDDAPGDAQWPHYGVQGANLPQLDLTSAKVSVRKGIAHVTMSVASLASLTPPPGRTQAVWLTRFQAPAPRTGGGKDVFQILYVGAQSTGGGPLSYFAGTTDCTETTPGNCKLFQYPAKVTAQGSVSGNTITIDVPLASGFGVPVHGTTLYNAAAFTFGRNNASTDLYADVDATAAFDVTVK